MIHNHQRRNPSPKSSLHRDSANAAGCDSTLTFSDLNHHSSSTETGDRKQSYS